MKDEKSILQDAVNAGFGLLSVTREKMEKLSEELVKRGEISRAQAGKWIADVEKNIDREMKILDKKVQTGVRDFIQRLKVPSRSEFDKLTREVKALRREVAKGRAAKRGKTTSRRAKKTG